jgi:hypothetical protein
VCRGKGDELVEPIVRDILVPVQRDHALRVRVTDFGERWNSRTPSSSSSLAIETESAGCDMAALIAAFVETAGLYDRGEVSDLSCNG